MAASPTRCSPWAPARIVWAAILLPNDFHFIEIDAACMRAGITRVGISSRLSADECQFIVAHSRAAVLITSPTLLAPLDPGALDGLTAILLIDGPAASQDRRRHYESTLSQAHSAFSASPVPPEHPAYILYTSGTMGRPEGRDPHPRQPGCGPEQHAGQRDRCRRGRRV